jgi:hypothetical protein
MQTDQLLEKCGNFHRYQLILLISYGFVNMMSSINFFSQTIITFIPKHWCVIIFNDSDLQLHLKIPSIFRCFSGTLENSSLEEIESIYSNYSKPSCTNFDNASLECEKWFYRLDYDYVSLIREVSGTSFDGAIR